MTTEERGALKFIADTDLDAIAEFIAAEKMRFLGHIGDLPIVWFGNKFKQHFLNVVEHNVPARRLQTWELTRGAQDPEIISTLGGESVEMYLAQLHRVIELGEQGPGHISNGWANFGYVRSPLDGDLWAVRWWVMDGGLCIGCRPRSHPGENNDGPRVFC